jgi:outer membrane murein-binding lipoprotein Lpp
MTHPPESKTRLPDSYPAPFERAVLEGRSLTAKPSPRFQLASEIRKLNAALEQLPVERQAALQPDWLDDWEALTAERESAKDDAAELQAIAAWADHWQHRLQMTTKEQRA